MNSREILEQIKGLSKEEKRKIFEELFNRYFSNDFDLYDKEDVINSKLFGDGEENELFDRPNNWNKIVSDCVKALKSLGLDIAAFDVKCEAGVKNPKWIILESNSAPALGGVGIEKYKQQLTKMLCD